MPDPTDREVSSIHTHTHAGNTGMVLPLAVHAIAEQCGLDWDLEESTSPSEPDSPLGLSGMEMVAEHNPSRQPPGKPRKGSARRKGATPGRRPPADRPARR